MTVKWIKEVHDAFYLHNEVGDLDAVDEILDRINLLLEIAGNETDNEFLHDDIMKEVKQNE